MPMKLNSTVKDAILNDLAIQYYVCKQRFGDRLRSFNLVLRVANDSWSISNRTSELELRWDEARIKIIEYQNVLENKEPNIALGKKCYTPYNCEFIDYCSKRMD